MKLLLASASPRRAELLRQAGVEFERILPQVDESRGANEPPGDYALRLAKATLGQDHAKTLGLMQNLAQQYILLLNAVRFVARWLFREQTRALFKSAMNVHT